MTGELQIPPATISRTFVVSKCSYFVDVQLWPLQSKMDPERWLSNFRDSEMDHAVHLLGAFLYYSHALVEELFKAAFQKLSSRIGCSDKPYEQSQAHWNQFRRNIIVTYVTGKRPSETDSGYIFARLARQALGIPENQIMSPIHALEALISDSPRPVIFVDDFVGSGDQCISTWHREMKLSDGTVTSFAKCSAAISTSFFYCPVVCTETGRQKIARLCSQLQLCPAHCLPNRYSVISENSIVWPERLRASAHDFLLTTSRRAGIARGRWAGYRNLGLALAFEHCVPNATLPLFYHEQNGWHPLVRRT